MVAMEYKDRVEAALGKGTVRRRSDRPQAIISAAIRLVGEHGFANTRLEDVAEAAGVSKAAIYLYFESKEDLFFALVREGALPTVADTNAAVARHEGSLSDLLQEIILGIGHLMAHTELGTIVKIVAAEARNFPELVTYHRDEVVARAMTTISGVIEKGIATGEFLPCDARAQAALCIFPVLMNGIWMNSIGPDPSIVDPDALLKAHAETFIRGLAA
jgi:AcrR family transcriptional regulator